jgi:hypothetical protein
VGIFQEVFLQRIYYKDSLVLVIDSPLQKKKDNTSGSKRVEATGSWSR